MSEEKLDIFLKVMGALILVPLIFFGTVLLGTLGGICVGWVVGLFFSNTILGIFSQLGIHDVSMWQVGAFLGFVGPFFRTVVSSKKE